MATVSNVQLHIQHSVTGKGDALVKVNYTLSFTPAEAGLKYRLRIRLHPEDKAGDDGGGGGLTLVAPPPIYTFKFNFADYLTVTASPGEQTFEQQRTVNIATLDEDPGSSQLVEEGDPTTNEDDTLIGIAPNSDEIYAVVSLSAEARSETFQMVYVPVPNP